MVNLLQFDRAGLGDFCEKIGEKRFRATQLFRWIHQRGERDPAAMTDLAKSLRDKLATSAVIEALPVASEQASADGTIKWLFDVGGGNAVETVFIPEDERGTLCVSSAEACSLTTLIAAMQARPASWPQAASMSSPRVLRTVVITPPSCRMRANAITRACGERFRPDAGNGLNGIRLN